MSPTRSLDRLLRRPFRPLGLLSVPAVGPSLLSVTAVGLTLALGGCGHPTRFARTTHAVPVILSEYRLRPSWVSVPAGRVTLRIRNLGRLAHDLVVGSATRALASSAAIPPGGTARLTVELAPGTYRLLSNLQNDETLGLRARLTVTRG